MARKQLSEKTLGKPSFTVDKELHKEFWNMAKDNNMNMSGWLEDRMREYIKKNRRKGAVKDEE